MQDTYSPILSLLLLVSAFLFFYSLPSHLPWYSHPSPTLRCSSPYRYSHSLFFFSPPPPSTFLLVLFSSTFTSLFFSPSCLFFSLCCSHLFLLLSSPFHRTRHLLNLLLFPHVLLSITAPTFSRLLLGFHLLILFLLFLVLHPTITPTCSISSHPLFLLSSSLLSTLLPPHSSLSPPRSSPYCYFHFFFHLLLLF